MKIHYLLKSLNWRVLLLNKETAVRKLKNEFSDRFLYIPHDYEKVRDFIYNEIEPKALNNLLFLYETLQKVKIRNLRKSMKKYYEGTLINIGKLKFHNE